MRGRSMNRLAWADGFTNDKRAVKNQEAYMKQCSRCTELIEMRPTKKGWKCCELTGEKHKCKK